MGYSGKLLHSLESSGNATCVRLSCENLFLQLGDLCLNYYAMVHVRFWFWKHLNSLFFHKGSHFWKGKNKEVGDTASNPERHLPFIGWHE